MVASRFVFMEWRDLPPGRAFRQAFVDRAPAVSQSNSEEAWAMGQMSPRHKTATLRRKPWGMGRYAGDRLNHPRYRDFAMIPETGFFQ